MESYNPGDKVYITDFYRANYRVWSKDHTEGVVKSAKMKMVRFEDIGKDERPIYQAKYGMLMDFPLWELHVEILGKLYIVSQLGFSK